ANNTTINSAVTNGATLLTLSGVPIVSGSITYTPTGTLTLTAPNATITAITLSGGTLALSGNGTLSSATSLIVNLGGTLRLDNSTVHNDNRIADGATVQFNGGTFDFRGINGAASNETIGNVTFNAGNSTVTSTTGTTTGSSAALTFGTYTRNPGATVNFQAG